MSTNLRLGRLSAEELALWDALASNKVATGSLAANAYEETRGEWMDLVKARRKALAMAVPSESKEAAK